MRGRLVVIALALVAIVVAAASSLGGDDDDGGGGSGDGSGAKPPDGAIRVSFAYSPEKEPLLKPLLEEFNRAGVEAAGAPVVVEPEIVASGEAQRRASPAGA